MYIRSTYWQDRPKARTPRGERQRKSKGIQNQGNFQGRAQFLCSHRHMPPLRDTPRRVGGRSRGQLTIRVPAVASGTRGPLLPDARWPMPAVP